MPSGGQALPPYHGNFDDDQWKARHMSGVNLREFTFWLGQALA